MPEVVGHTIKIKPPIVVRDFAVSLSLKPFRLISELMEMGIFASINQSLEVDVAQKIAQKHGFTLDVQHRGEQEVKKAPEVKKVVLESRPPIVCVLGHVDHGKTTLLDSIRKTNVVAGEAGGITQHIGAYQVTSNGQKITFIDTPGHAAFSKMRQRGADVTDIAILVVAADDGFMPQTEEAFKFAKKANVPVVVAINKMDAKGANIDRVKQQMQQRGIAPEDWGGETLCVPVSALKGDNLPKLLEAVLLQAEMMELSADFKGTVEGVIIESQIEVGRGPTATVIIQKGILKPGDAIVCGSHYCKVRAMIDDQGKTIKEAPPSTPVKVMGWSDVPDAGATFIGVKSEKDARQQAQDFADQTKDGSPTQKTIATGNDKKANVDALFAAIASSKSKVLKVILRGDVNGSVEALSSCLEAIKSTKVTLEIISAEVGQINKTDIDLASSTGATIVGFNTKLENGVQSLAKHHSIRILQHNIIYEIIDQVKEAMAELLDPEIQRLKTGTAEVRQVFPLSKAGVVAGCMVTEGSIKREQIAAVIRKDQVLCEGRISALKRFKEDSSEVRSGYECGIQLSNFNEYEVGDHIEVFEIKKILPSL